MKPVRTGPVTMTRSIAVFDFDHCLVRQSSQMLFLSALLGKARCCAVYAAAASRALIAPRPRRREMFRVNLVRNAVAGRTQMEAQDAAERMFPSLSWNWSLLSQLHKHQEASHLIVIATGGLACYMHRLVEMKGIAVDGLLATELCIERGCFTGEIVGASCTGEVKARRIRQWLPDGPREIWAYGNLPHDAAMLAMSDHPTVIRQ